MEDAGLISWKFLKLKHSKPKRKVVKKHHLLKKDKTWMIWSQYLERPGSTYLTYKSQAQTVWLTELLWRRAPLLSKKLKKMEMSGLIRKILSLFLRLLRLMSTFRSVCQIPWYQRQIVLARLLQKRLWLPRLWLSGPSLRLQLMILVNSVLLLSRLWHVNTIPCFRMILSVRHRSPCRPRSLTTYMKRERRSFCTKSTSQESIIFLRSAWRRP